MLSLLTPGTPYLVSRSAFAVLGAGMSITAAPATGEIMSAVPLSKAGVGSAVNDTTRELGGALGIAILGSIANSAYRVRHRLVGIGLARRAQRTAEESVGPPRPSPAAGPAAARVKARGGRRVHRRVQPREPVSVGIALAAAVAVLCFSPRRREPKPADEPSRTDGLDLELGAGSRPGRAEAQNEARGGHRAGTRASSGRGE